MRNADDAVEKVLAGLRAAEGSPGLEQRVWDRLRRRMAQGEASDGHSGTFVFGWRLVGFGCGGMAALLVIALCVFRIERRGVTAHALAIDRQMTRGAVGAARTSVDRAVGSGTSVPPQLKPHSGQVGGGLAEAMPLSKADSFESLAGVKPMRGKEVAESASFPAPPQPLTEQERLLLRVANHSGPDEVAMLDPVARATKDVEETAVFLDFFGRPESVEQTIQKVNPGESR